MGFKLADGMKLDMLKLKYKKTLEENDDIKNEKIKKINYRSKKKFLNKFKIYL